MKLFEVHAPEAMRAFVGFRQGRFGGRQALKELIAFGVTFTTQCPYCIQIHANNAREAGASDPEIAETVLVAVALRAGGAITHGTHAFNGA
jgi:AhpD family alkylhydroperoxidase